MSGAYERKFQAAIAELEQTGIWRSNYNPPALRVQRWLGQEARPPHYAVLWKTIIGYGVWFAGVWGILMWVVLWRSQGLPFRSAAIAAVSAGLFFGATMGAYYAWARRKHGLRRWEDL